VIASTPSRCRPSPLLSPVYLYLCSLFVFCQFVLFVQVNQRFVSQLLLFPVCLFSPSWFWPLSVLTPSPPAWPLCLPLSLHISPLLDYRRLPAARYRCPTSAYWPLPALTCLFPDPVGILNYCLFDMVCIWVIPSYMISSLLQYNVLSRKLSKRDWICCCLIVFLGRFPHYFPSIYSIY
jgi:hypothetical protein